MKLVTGQFNDSYAPIIDGVAMVTEQYAGHLNRILGPSYVVTPRYPAPQDLDSGAGGGTGTWEKTIAVLRYRSVPLPVKMQYRLGVPLLDRPFLTRLRSCPFDLVHAQSPFTAGRLALRISKRMGIPMVASFHTKYHESFLRVLGVGPIVDACMTSVARFYESASEVWVPNQSTAQTLRSYGYRGGFSVVGNGTDIDIDSDSESFRVMSGRELGIEDGEFVFLYIGQLIREKNLDFLLRSLAEVKRTGRRFLALFAGTGFAKRELMRLTAELGVEDKTRFLGLVTDRSRIKRLYARADLFLFPSLYDTSPLTLREAAAFRLPLVLIEGATAAEGVVDGKNGFLERREIGKFAVKLSYLMDHPETIRAAGEGARRTFHRTWAQVAEEVAERYRNIVVDFQQR